MQFAGVLDIVRGRDRHQQKAIDLIFHFVKKFAPYGVKDAKQKFQSKMDKYVPISTMVLFYW